MNRTSRLALSISLIALVAAGVPAHAGNNVRSSGRSNVNSNRNVNVDVDVDHHHHGGYYGGGCCYHSGVGTAMAVTATAMVTAAVIGSMVNTLPPSCSTVIVNGFAYQQCGSTWYQPQISGSSTSYIVINAPR